MVAPWCCTAFTFALHDVRLYARASVLCMLSFYKHVCHVVIAAAAYEHAHPAVAATVPRPPARLQ